MEHTPEPGVAGTFALYALDVPLAPGELDPSQVIDGSPQVTEVVLSESADGRVVRGLWRITEGTVTDTEQDELFVVLEGRATIAVHDGPTLEVGPGDVCVLERGARTTWTVHEPLPKVFQITLADGEPSSGRA
ncbi:MAG: cupin domain-containing protein [Actinomycetota bacterium]